MYTASSGYVFSLLNLSLPGGRAHAALFLIRGCCWKRLSRRCYRWDWMGLMKSWSPGRGPWSGAGLLCSVQHWQAWPGPCYGTAQSYKGWAAPWWRQGCFQAVSQGLLWVRGQQEALAAAPPAGPGFIAFGWGRGWAVRKANSPQKVREPQVYWAEIPGLGRQTWSLRCDNHAVWQALRYIQLGWIACCRYIMSTPWLLQHWRGCILEAECRAPLRHLYLYLYETLILVRRYPI